MQSHECIYECSVSFQRFFSDMQIRGSFPKFGEKRKIEMRLHCSVPLENRERMDKNISDFLHPFDLELHLTFRGPTYDVGKKNEA